MPESCQAFPRISFGMIVLNGEPFLRFNLRALYPFAHQIIVIEGAAPAAAEYASLDGHSTDGTLETLRQFRKTEDPMGKVSVVRAEDEGHPNGFWPGEKDEMSRAYAERATGDYLWQVDSDEFYLAKDMSAVRTLLAREPDLTALSFRQKTFWGSPDYCLDGQFLRGTMTGSEYHRVFKWGPGYRYVTHRPPTVRNDQGRDVRDIRWLNSRNTRAMGITLYHYSLLFPAQVSQKVNYYERFMRRPGRAWQSQGWDALGRPFHVHNVPDYAAWLERFRGEHPEQVKAMWAAVTRGETSAPVRRMDDVRMLLRDPSFIAVRWLARRWPDEARMNRRGMARLEETIEWLIAWFERDWQRKRERRARYAARTGAGGG